MMIQITGRHIDVTKFLKKYIEDKLSKLAHHFDNIISIKIILSLEKNIFISEAIILVPGSKVIAKSESSDMYTAIDLLENKLDVQIIKYKQKMRDHKVDKEIHTNDVI